MLNASNALQAPQYHVYTPPRQPTGPDSTTGFTARQLAAGIIDDAEPSPAPDTENHFDINDSQSPTSTVDTTTANANATVKISASQALLNPSVPPFTASAAAYAT